jgi:hypothetical protein
LKKPTAEEIIKLILGEFGDKDIVAKISSDDGGQVLEVWVQGEEDSIKIRKLIPLNYEGWRTVVFNNSSSQED